MADGTKKSGLDQVVDFLSIATGGTRQYLNNMEQDLNAYDSELKKERATVNLSMSNLEVGRVKNYLTMYLSDEENADEISRWTTDDYSSFVNGIPAKIGIDVSQFSDPISKMNFISKLNETKDTGLQSVKQYQDARNLSDLETRTRDVILANRGDTSIDNMRDDMDSLHSLAKHYDVPYSKLTSIVGSYLKDNAKYDGASGIAQWYMGNKAYGNDVALMTDIEEGLQTHADNSNTLAVEQGVNDLYIKRDKPLTRKESDKLINDFLAKNFSTRSETEQAAQVANLRAGIVAMAQQGYDPFSIANHPFSVSYGILAGQIEVDKLGLELEKIYTELAFKQKRIEVRNALSGDNGNYGQSNLTSEQQRFWDDLTPAQKQNDVDASYANHLNNLGPRPAPPDPKKVDKTDYNYFYDNSMGIAATESAWNEIYNITMESKFQTDAEYYDRRVMLGMLKIIKASGGYIPTPVQNTLAVLNRAIGSPTFDPKNPVTDIDGQDVDEFTPAMDFGYMLWRSGIDLTGVIDDDKMEIMNAAFKARMFGFTNEQAFMAAKGMEDPGNFEGSKAFEKLQENNWFRQDGPLKDFQEFADQGFIRNDLEFLSVMYMNLGMNYDAATAAASEQFKAQYAIQVFKDNDGNENRYVYRSGVSNFNAGTQSMSVQDAMDIFNKEYAKSSTIKKSIREYNNPRIAENKRIEAENKKRAESGEPLLPLLTLMKSSDLFTRFQNIPGVAKKVRVIIMDKNTGEPVEGLFYTSVININVLSNSNMLQSLQMQPTQREKAEEQADKKQVEEALQEFKEQTADVPQANLEDASTLDRTVEGLILPDRDQAILEPVTPLVNEALKTGAVGVWDGAKWLGGVGIDATKWVGGVGSSFVKWIGKGIDAYNAGRPDYSKKMEEFKK